jgi:hypothetical protein
VPGPQTLLLERCLREDVVRNRDVEADRVEDELGPLTSPERIFERDVVRDPAALTL